MRDLARASQRLGCGVIALLVPVSGAAVGCRSKPSPDQAASLTLAPVPAPSGLLAEGILATPDATWQRLQRGGGGGAGLLPTSIGGLLAGALGLDPRLGLEVNGASPVYVVAAGDGASPAWVFAARLTEERRARPLLEGPGAVAGVRDGGEGLTILVPSGKRGSEEIVSAVAPGGWLVVASGLAALSDLAPYATRTLPAKLGAGDAAIAIDVLPSALAGPLADAATKGWDGTQRAMLENDRALREAHGGRAPDYGDPRAIIASLDSWIQKRISPLRDLAGAHFSIDVNEGDVRVTVNAPFASSAGAASALAAGFHAGDVTPLATVPRETVLGLLLRDEVRARASDGVELEAALTTTLGPRVSLDDGNRIHRAIDDWFQSRGDWVSLALTMTPTERGFVADVAATDPARASRSVREAIEVYAHVPAIHEPLSDWLHARAVTFGAGAIPGGGRASTATFKTDQGSPLAIAWTSSPAEAPGPPEAGDVKLALGVAPLPLLAPAMPGATLADDPELRAAFGSLGSVAGAIVVQPSRIPGCTATGGILFAWGTRPAGGAAAPGEARKDALWATLVASDSSLRCAVKSLF